MRGSPVFFAGHDHAAISTGWGWVVQAVFIGRQIALSVILSVVVIGWMRGRDTNFSARYICSMNTLILLRDLFIYDYRANSAFAALPLPEGALRLFGHILGAQRVWWERIRQQPAGATSWPGLSIGECRELMETMHDRWSGYLSEISQEKLGETISYTNLQGNPAEAVPGDILMHVVNHGTYHRGQMAQMLRRHGMNPPRTDYIAYAQER